MTVSELQVQDGRRFVENLEVAITCARPGEKIHGLDAIDGTDASGTVYCVVDLAGALSQVGIVDGWWEAVGPRGVAAAVLQAWRFSRDKAGLARLVLDRRRVPYIVPTPDYRALFTSEPPRDLPPYDAPDFVDELRRTIDRAATVLTNVKQFVDDRDHSRRHETTGPRGLFRVILSGHTVIDARVDDVRLRSTDGAELAADARDALLAARPAFQRRQQGS